MEDGDIEFYRSLIDKYPDIEKGYLLLGNLYRYKGRKSECITVYETAVRKFPEMKWAWLRLAEAYMADDKFAQAIPCYENVVEMNKFDHVNNSDSPADETKVWEGLSQAYRRTHEHRKAAQCYKKAIKMHSDSSPRHRGLSLVNPDETDVASHTQMNVLHRCSNEKEVNPGWTCHFLPKKLLDERAIDIFMVGVHVYMKPKEIDTSNGRGTQVSAGRFYEVKLLAMKPGWVRVPGVPNALLEIKEDHEGRIMLPKPFAKIFREMRTALLGQSLVVECEEGFDLSGLNCEEWSRFRRELRLAIVDRYKDGTYRDESGPVEPRQDGVGWMERDGFEAIPPSTFLEDKELQGHWPQGRWSEPVDMTHFRTDWEDE
jgi:hypothetical protein